MKDQTLNFFRRLEPLKFWSPTAPIFYLRPRFLHPVKYKVLFLFKEWNYFMKHFFKAFCLLFKPHIFCLDNRKMLTKVKFGRVFNTI